MQTVPLQDAPNQSLNVTLANQPCQINIYQLATGLYIDLYVNATPIITGVICQNANRIVRDAYLGFIGDLAFFDTFATAQNPPTDPVYAGLDVQYVLVYLEASDLGVAG